MQGLEVVACALLCLYFCAGVFARRAQVTAEASAAATAEEQDAPLVNGLTLDQRFQLCRSIGEECITGE